MEFKGLGKNSAKMLWDKVKSTLFNKSVTDISISGKTVTITKGDGTKSMQTTQDTNTTYGVVSKTADGLAPKLPNETGTTKYLRQDGTWAVPPDTTYNVFEGATGTYKGKEGLVPAPGNYNDVSVLTSGGKWAMLGGRMFYDSDEVGSVLELKVGDKLSGSITLQRATEDQDGVMPRAMYSKLNTLPTGTEISDTYAKKSDITGVYRPKGSVADASKLPTSGQQVGDVWSIEADSAFGPAGMNVVWTSDGKWDNLGGIVTMVEFTQEDIDEICV